MEALEFIHEQWRMCDFYGNCKQDNKCPFRSHKNILGIKCCNDFICHEPSEAINIVEKWSKENPK